jgi:predicted phosphohydrolase
MDIFGGNWKNYEEKLKEYWLYMIRPEDTVVIPGDISWGMSLDEAKEDLAFLHRLPGKKILMKGNHDYWWTSLAKLEAFLEENDFSSLRFLHNDALLAEGKVICGSRGWMCEDKMGENDVKVLRREALRFGISLKKAKEIADREEAEHGIRPELICFSHYPIVSSFKRDNPILDVLKEYGVRRVYYGHLHNCFTKPPYEDSDGIRFTLVSSDYCQFTPVRIP